MTKTRRKTLYLTPALVTKFMAKVTEEKLKSETFTSESDVAEALLRKALGMKAEKVAQ